MAQHRRGTAGPARRARAHQAALAVAALCACAHARPAAAQAVTLKPFTEMAGPVVRLSDLFAGVAPADDRELGPAPAPGSRITVEAPQLVAIAHQFGVEWQAASPSDRAVLERDGRPLTREALLAAMRPALAAAGAPPDAELDLGSFAPPMLPTDGSQLDVSQLEYDGASGRFTALLSIGGPGGEPTRLRLAGSVAAMMELPVLQHRATPGVVIEAGDLQVTRVRAQLVRGTPAMTVGQVAGLVARRPIPAGQPIPMADLGRPAAVERGAVVMLLLDTAGMTLTAQGQALDSGALGERVRVMNPASHAVLSGVIEAAGRVRVTPGSGPITGAPLPPRSYALATSLEAVP